MLKPELPSDDSATMTTTWTVTTTTHVQRFAVAYEFPVVFTAALFDPANPVFADTLRRREPGVRHRCLVIVDQGFAAAWPTLAEDIVIYVAHHAESIELVAAPLIVAGGETIKTDLAILIALQRALLDHHIDRHAFVVAIGGGAVLDAVGLIAATTHRGVRLVRVPTTVLGQNDSGVGVKNGVNLFGQKNYCGTFAPPFAVLNDLDILEVLPRRERIAGIAEAVKVALIRDEAFFVWLETNADALVRLDRAATATMIRRCAALHMQQIGRGGDPFETGSARPLDFGHWAAHRLETLTDHRLRHGEAVAIGVALDTRYSVLAGLLDADAADRVVALLDRLGLPTWHPALIATTPDGTRAILRGLAEFREHLGGELTITLLAAIGTGIEVHRMEGATILDAVTWLAERVSV